MEICSYQLVSDRFSFAALFFPPWYWAGAAGVTRMAVAQGDVYGPDAVFDPPADFNRALFDCQGPTCVADTMRAFVGRRIGLLSSSPPPMAATWLLWRARPVLIGPS